MLSCVAFPLQHAAATRLVPLFMYTDMHTDFINFTVLYNNVTVCAAVACPGGTQGRVYTRGARQSHQQERLVLSPRRQRATVGLSRI